MKSEDICAHCGSTPAPFENPKRAKQFLCFDCLDRTAPKYVDRYPGWREREAAKRRQSDQGRKNFSHRITETQSGLFAGL